MRTFVLMAMLAICAPLGAAARAMKPLEIKSQYREILSLLASGGNDQALAELVDFEIRAVGATQAWRYVDNLWKSELHVIRDLLASQPPDLLRPIVSLHHDAYFTYVERERRYLAGHARTMAAELAEVYAQRMESQEASLFSGWVLTSLGAKLWNPSAVRESADLFYRAYLVDPANGLAVRGLAAAYEKNGDYEKAMEYLSQALLQDPGDQEVRLRLALCRLRWQDDRFDRDALALLESLTGEGTPMWIRSLAFQELARFHLESDEPGRSEEILRQGLTALPADQQLSILLAGLLDRQRRRSEALDLLAALGSDGWQDESPRERYDVWQPAGVETARANHLQGGRQGLVALETGLSASPVGTEGR